MSQFKNVNLSSSDTNISKHNRSTFIHTLITSMIEYDSKRVHSISYTQSPEL